MAAWAGSSSLVLTRGGDDVTEPDLGLFDHVRVGVLGQPQVVLGAAKVGVAHVAGQVRQHHGKVLAGLSPASQVRDREAVTQRVWMRTAGEVRDAGLSPADTQPHVRSE